MLFNKMSILEYSKQVTTVTRSAVFFFSILGISEKTNLVGLKSVFVDL